VQHTSFEGAECPIARGLELVGEWWTMLILRDAFDGFTRFDQFEANLGIAPNTLTRRLTSLVDAGLLERRRYSAHARRYEYVLTPRGREFRPVILALYAWMDRDLAPERRSMVLTDLETGAEVQPVLVDRATGRPIEDIDVIFSPGPAASDRIRFRLARTRAS
jgi:DNA-binding HxlR family transcriptional regulator